MESIRINMEDHALPDVTIKPKKPKENPKRQREPQHYPETKRMKRGGPPALPPSWRNKQPEEMVMSFASPEVSDGQTLVILQASSQLPAFGHSCIQLSGEVRENRVSDNFMGDEYLWSPITSPFWDPCRKKLMLQHAMAASHMECSLCPGARAKDLLLCC